MQGKPIALRHPLKFRACHLRVAPSRVAALVLILVMTAVLASCKKAEDGATDKTSDSGNKFDASSPKKAAVTFARALEANDVEGARKVAVGTDAEFALAKGFGDIMRSLRSYEAVAVEKLGEDGKLSQDEMIDLVDLVAAFNSGAEKVEGDTGTLTIKGGTIVHFKKEGDSWKVDLKFLDSDAQAEASAKTMPDKARVLDEVKKDIQNNTYARARNALDAVKSGLKQLEGESPAARVKKDIERLTRCVELYKNNLDSFPPNLDALVKNPGNLENWKGPYTDRSDPLVPLDPWGHPYLYVAPGKHNPDSFDLSSAGDGKHPPQGLAQLVDQS